MSKAIFSALLILALFSGINCAASKYTDKHTSKGGDSPACTVGLVLNLGDECSGLNYKIRNKGGHLLVTGPYMDLNLPSGVHGEGFTINSEHHPGVWMHGDLVLNKKDGNAWIIKSVPLSTFSIPPKPD